MINVVGSVLPLLCGSMCALPLLCGLVCAMLLLLHCILYFRLFFFDCPLEYMFEMMSRMICDAIPDKLGFTKLATDDPRRVKACIQWLALFCISVRIGCVTYACLVGLKIGNRLSSTVAKTEKHCGNLGGVYRRKKESEDSALEKRNH